MNNRISRRALACLLFAGASFTALTATAVHAQAQGGTADAIPAERYTLSPGGVDMRTGQYRYKQTNLSIGGENGIDLELQNGTNDRTTQKAMGNFSHNWEIYVYEKANIAQCQIENCQNTIESYQVPITADGRSNTFIVAYPITDGMTTYADVDYAKLTVSGTGTQRVYTYSAKDGAIITFLPIGSQCGGRSNCAYASSIVEPDGTRFDLQYDTDTAGVSRLRRVTSNLGHILIFEYPAGTRLVSKVCAINAGFTIPPVTNACPSGARSASYSYLANGHLAQVTDAAGAIHKFGSTWTASGNTPYAISFTRPGETSPYLTNNIRRDLITVLKGRTDAVESQTFADGRTFAYGWHIVDHNEQSQEIAGGSYVQNDGSGAAVNFAEYMLYGGKQKRVGPGPSSITDEIGRTTTADYCEPLSSWCAVVPVRSWTLPEGNQVKFSRDAAGNVTETRRIAKSASGLADLVTAATFSCVTFVVCSKPTSITDAKNNKADYSYDPAHGGILSEMKPAPVTGAARPLKLSTWTQKYAYIKNAAGTLVQAASPVWVLATSTECQTAAGSNSPVCDNAAPKQVTTYLYGANGTANTLLVRGTAVTADGVTRRTCMTYDSFGNRISQTSARAGLATCA